jgi:DNA-binding NarL/FixJ family response regulator
MVTKLQPAVVLMDINLPKMDGITATRFIKTNYPDIAVIGFSMTVYSYSEYAMLKAGAFEVLPKDKAVHELYSAIQRAVASTKPVVILTEATLTQSAPKDSEAATSTSSSSSGVVIEESHSPQENAQ